MGGMPCVLVKAMRVPVFFWGAFTPPPAQGAKPLTPSPFMGEGWGGGVNWAPALNVTPSPTPPHKGEGLKRRFASAGRG